MDNVQQPPEHPEAILNRNAQAIATEVDGLGRDLNAMLAAQATAVAPAPNEELLSDGPAFVDSDEERDIWEGGNRGLLWSSFEKAHPGVTEKLTVEERAHIDRNMRNLRQSRGEIAQASKAIEEDWEDRHKRLTKKNEELRTKIREQERRIEGLQAQSNTTLNGTGHAQAGPTMGQGPFYTNAMQPFGVPVLSGLPFPSAFPAQSFYPPQPIYPAGLVMHQSPNRYAPYPARGRNGRGRASGTNRDRGSRGQDGGSRRRNRTDGDAQSLAGRGEEDDTHGN